MKLIHRTSLNKACTSKLNMDFNLQRQTIINKKNPSSIEQRREIKYSKNDAMLRRGIERSINQIQYLNDKNTATRASTNPIYDSRKEAMNLQKGDGFRILPVSQIKVRKSLFNDEQKKSIPTNRSKKIFVSISKTNRTSQSRDKSSSGTPNLSDIGNKRNYLSALNKTNHIMEKIEYQMKQPSRFSNFFCN